MRDRVLVCGSGSRTLASLSSFFKRRKNMKVEFMDNVYSLRERASKDKEQNLV